MSETLSLTLTDVPGVQAGHWTHESTTTGCTAVVFAGGARGGVAVPGHAPGSRELLAVIRQRCRAVAKQMATDDADTDELEAMY